MMKKLMRLTIACFVFGLLFTGFSVRAFADVDDVYEDEIMELGEDLVEGDRVLFGKYEQDGNKENGKEAIEWQVLDVKDDKVLLISKYVLEIRPYHNVEKDITWEKSHLRKWMNRNFLKAVFSKEENKKILKTNLDNKGNEATKIKGGKNTKDKVFLLSIKEMASYLETNEERWTSFTDYAVKRLAKITKREESSVKNKVWYWLRSPGERKSKASYVGYGSPGYISETGYWVNDKTAGIRPAIWVKIK